MTRHVGLESNILKLDNRPNYFYFKENDENSEKTGFLYRKILTKLWKAVANRTNVKLAISNLNIAANGITTVCIC